MDRKFFGSVASALLLATSGAAHAQNAQTNPASCNNFAAVPDTTIRSCVVTPYTAQYEGKTATGTRVTLTCAWKPGIDGPEVDASYNEQSFRNDYYHLAKRLQKIDDVYVATDGINAKNDAQKFDAQIETFTTEAVLAAKKCTVDTKKDTRTKCKPTAAFVDTAKAFSAAANATSVCAPFVKALADGGLITNEKYSQQQAVALHKKLRASIADLRQ